MQIKKIHFMCMVLMAYGRHLKIHVTAAIAKQNSSDGKSFFLLISITCTKCHFREMCKSSDRKISHWYYVLNIVSLFKIWWTVTNVCLLSNYIVIFCSFIPKRKPLKLCGICAALSLFLRSKHTSSAKNTKPNFKLNPTVFFITIKSNKKIITIYGIIR